MKIDKPLISIVMAVYNPRLDWLREQLESLNAQTYPNLELLVRDDCSPAVPYDDIRALISVCITKFPCAASRNEKNLGSNGTFERLTEQANGGYIAYCDQDDIWLPEKLEMLQLLMSKDVSFAYSDMSVMDGAGRQVASTLKAIRPRLSYRHGPDLERFYFFRNCTAGCSMLVRAALAKSAVPFPEKTVYDQWICLVASKSGAAAFTEKPLVRYRRHGGNQTGILTGVTCKKDYYAMRVVPLQERLEAYARYGGPESGISEFVRARVERRIFGIWKGRRYSGNEALLEAAMGFMPEDMFKKLLAKVKGSE